MRNLDSVMYHVDKVRGNAVFSSVGCYSVSTSYSPAVTVKAKH